MPSEEEEAPPLVAPDTQPPLLNAIAQRAVERAKKRGNSFLTNAQRQALCLHATATQCTQAQLCVWAQDAFALGEPLHQSTVSRILADRNKFLAIDGSSLAQKRRTYVEHPELEAALAHWLLVASHGGRRVPGDAIKEKGRAFAQQLGIESKISFSNGWLTGFKKRHHAVLAVSASADSEEVAPLADDGSAAFDWDMQHAIQDYDPQDVFALGVTGLLYALVPEKPPRRTGGDRTGRGAAATPVKDKLTLLLAVNATGSERVAPLFVGSSKLLVRDAPPSYTARKKSSSQPAGAADAADAEPAFSYCYSERAWLNAPFDAEIVAAFKRRYRRRQLLHALDCHEAGSASVFSVAEAQAIRWCCAAWSEVPAVLVSNCWADANVLGGLVTRADTTAVREAEDGLELAIKDIAFKLPLRRVMALKELLSPADESESLHFVGVSERDFLAVRDELPPPLSNGSAATVDAHSDFCDTLSTSVAFRLFENDALVPDRELLAHVQKIVPNLERFGCDERTIQAMRDSL
ncbi:hypothetical protein PybrP1_000950 [[Pythium] brassicae (nom. inval.)]|nr:hypothetical protein PybrP1_000950 [[Pythium] brassicae (nom. inval.)]